MTSLIQSALGLASLDIPTFPLRSNKRPCLEGSFKDASTDPATVERLFADPLAALIGVPTGAVSGFDVLDIDTKNAGDEWLRDNEHRLPATRRHHTRSGGVHLLFRHQPGMGNSASRIAPGVDVRGDGGYVVWHPAQGFHTSGNGNAEWPAWLLVSALRNVNPNTPVPDAEPLAPPDVGALLALIQATPNPAETTRDEYTAVNLAVQGCIRSLEALGRLDDPTPVYDAAAEWSARWDSSDASDFDTERARWDDDWSTRDNDISGWRHLLGIAGKLGADVSAFTLTAAAAEFGPLPAEPASAEPAASDRPLILDRAAPLASAKILVSRRFTVEGKRSLHHQKAGFFRWAGTHYAEAPIEEIRSVAYHFLDGAHHIKDEQLVPFNPTRSRVADVLEALGAATQLPPSVRDPAWLDADAGRPPAAEMLSCANGLLHLPTRRLMPHTPLFFSRNAIGYAYDAAAPAPAEWLAFLHTLWGDDPASTETLQELFGLLLTADTRHQKIFLLVGPKRSGKGTIGRVLKEMLGSANVCNPTLAALAQNFGLAPLIGKPLAMISDARLGGRSDPHIIAERLLSISGEDGQTIDRKYLDPWNGTLPTRFVVLTNEIPRLTDASGALASRFVIMQMTRSFYGCEDKGLTARLLPELPGILNWAIAGLDRLNARGHFVQPASALEAIAELEDLASPIGAFLKATCRVGPEHSVSCDNLHVAWLAWCREQGREHLGTKQTFGRDVRAAVPGLATRQVRMPDGERVREYQGVALAMPNRFDRVPAPREDSMAEITALLS